MIARAARLIRTILVVLGLVTIRPAFSTDSLLAQTDADLVIVEWVLGDTPDGGWTVGDPISIKLVAHYPDTLDLTLPDLPEHWGAVEVLKQSPLEPVANTDGTLTAVHEAEVAIWAPGDHQTPPLAAHYRDSVGELHEIAVPPVSISIASVLSEGETEKRDLKPQVSLPLPSRWPFLLAGLLGGLVISAVAWVLLSRRRTVTRISTATIPADPRPPHEIAYDELDHIAALDLPALGELKRHYSLVSDCLRTYIYGRYHISALDCTTGELMVAFRQTQVDRSHAGLVRRLLAEADLVKFAKLRPPIEQARESVVVARHIVDLTKASTSENGATDESVIGRSQHESKIVNR